MVNPRLGILSVLNPHNKRKKGAKMARRRSRSYMAWVRSHKRKGRKHSPRRRRRNPYPIAGVALNPRRRRSSPRRHARRRRNPAMFGGSRVMGFQLPNLGNVVYAGVGFLAPPMAESFLGQYLPSSLTSNTLGKYVVRIGSVLGLTWLAKSFIGREKARMVGIGGGAWVLITAVREFAPGLIPGMSAYALPASGLRAYVPSHGRNVTGLGAPAFGATNTIASAAGGGRNIVASRFRRFQ